MFNVIWSVFLFMGDVAQRQAPVAPEEGNCTYYLIAIGTMATAIGAQWLWMKSLSNKASEAEDKRAEFAEDMVRMLERQNKQGGSS